MQKALQYETEVLSHGKQLLDDQHWQQAYLTYEQGLEKLPGSAAIQAAMHEFLLQRDAYIKQLSYQILLNKSQVILANDPLQKKITTAVPDDYAYQIQTRHHEEEKNDVAAKLIECAEYSLKANQLVTSQRCLSLASRLYDKSPPKNQQVLQEQLNKKRQALSRLLSETAQINLSAAEDSLKNNRLKEAMDYLKKVPAEEQQKPAVKKLQQQLSEKIKRAVKKGAARGRKLYSDGKIKAALERWQALLVLDPGNQELRKLIDRAERVLKKLKSLGSKPAATVK